MLAYYFNNEKGFMIILILYNTRGVRGRLIMLVLILGYALVDYFINNVLILNMIVRCCRGLNFEIYVYINIIGQYVM